MEFYSVAVKHPRRVYDEFAALRRDSKTYYLVRNQYKTDRSTIRRSAYFFYLNRNCFNGIFRVNKRGQFNVPFSDSRVPAYPSEDDFFESISALKRARLDCADFFDLCSRHVSCGDFVYLDPPYYVPRQRVFREYVPHDFARDDVDRLTSALKMIDHRGALFLLNYPDCSMMRLIAREWAHHFIETRRTISGALRARGPRSEIFVYNFEERNGSI